MEEWRDIPNFPGYAVSNLGRIKSFKYKTPRIMALTTSRKGYKRVGLMCPQTGKKRTKLVHRLMYSAFVRPLKVHEQIDHINRIKDDNRLENFRIANTSQNVANSRKRKKKCSDNKHLPKGITPYKDCYRVSITCNYKSYYLGCYRTIEEAALVYNHKAAELFGEFACPILVDTELTIDAVEKVFFNESELPLGVSRSSCKKDSYVARISKDNKTYHLGSYATPEEAALAYNDAAYKMYGDEAELNDIDFQTLWDALRAKFDRERNKLPRGITNYHNKYKSEVSKNKKRFYLGLFKTIEEAVAARNRKLLELKGEL